MEIWKEVKDYPDYQISNFGNVKSLKHGKEKILKKGVDTVGYLMINLSFNGIQKTRNIHQLVAEAFLNHIPNGFELVINHINFNKADNRVENLEIVTTRENSNRKHLKSSSQFVGVSWSKENKKWRAQIRVNRKLIHLGYFTTEKEASNTYQNYLNK